MNDKKIDEALEKFVETDDVQLPPPFYISERIYGRMADMTLGYVITSFVCLMALSHILPQLYAASDKIFQATNRMPELWQLMPAFFSESDNLMSILTLAGFFIGGLGLFHSVSWGRSFLGYMFTFQALVLVFDNRAYLLSCLPGRSDYMFMLFYFKGIFTFELFRHWYSAGLGAAVFETIVFIFMVVMHLLPPAFVYFFYVKNDRWLKITVYTAAAMMIGLFGYADITQRSFYIFLRDITMIALVTSPYFIVLSFVYLIYNDHRLAVIRMMTFVSTLFTVLNIFLVSSFFMTPPPNAYLGRFSIFFIAVVAVITWRCGTVFLPLAGDRQLWFSKK